jgi:hypothetical protein
MDAGLQTVAKGFRESTLLIIYSSEMSIIVGLASDYNGIVASDGRRFAPGKVENGKVVAPGPVDSDEFDKTFEIAGGVIVGAFAGLMCFSGKNVGEHVAEIFKSCDCAGSAFAEVVSTVRREMESRLLEIDEEEVVLSFRKIDLLLVAGAQLGKKGHQIAAVRLFPDNGGIKSELEMVFPNGAVRYYVFGEDKARDGAFRVMKANSSTNKSATFLKMLAARAVKAGINKAGPRPDGGSEAACGGSVFSKSTRYK